MLIIRLWLVRWNFEAMDRKLKIKNMTKSGVIGQLVWPSMILLPTVQVKRNASTNWAILSKFGYNQFHAMLSLWAIG